MSVKQSTSNSWNKRNRDKCREYSRRYQAKKKALMEAKKLVIERFNAEKAAAKEAKRLVAEKKSKKQVRYTNEENIKRVLDFYHEHRRKPSKTDEPDCKDEKALWYWIDTLYRKTKKNSIKILTDLKDQFLEKYGKDYDEVWNTKPKMYKRNGVYKKRETSVQTSINPFEDTEILLITIKNKDKEIEELKEKIKIMENTMMNLNSVIV